MKKRERKWNGNNNKHVRNLGKVTLNVVVCTNLNEITMDCDGSTECIYSKKCNVFEETFDALKTCKRWNWFKEPLLLSNRIDEIAIVNLGQCFKVKISQLLANTLSRYSSISIEMQQMAMITFYKIRFPFIAHVLLSFACVERHNKMLTEQTEVTMTCFLDISTTN